MNPSEVYQSIVSRNVGNANHRDSFEHRFDEIGVVLQYLFYRRPFQLRGACIPKQSHGVRITAENRLRQHGAFVLIQLFQVGAVRNQQLCNVEPSEPDSP